MSEQKSKITPNTFQTPNVLVDDYMRYLTGNETKCYLVIVRKTLGWLKRRDRIALSQIMELTGMGDAPARESMKELCRFGLVSKTAENDPARNLGPEYELELDDMKISMAGLVERDNARKAVSSRQTSKARARLEAKRSDPLLLTEPPIVEQSAPPIVEQTTQKPLSKATINKDSGAQKQERPASKTADPIIAALYSSGIIPNAKTLDFLTLWRGVDDAGERIHTDERIIQAIKAHPGKAQEYIDKVLISWQANGYPKTREELLSDAKRQNPQRPQNTSLPQAQEQLKAWLAMQGAQA